MKKDIKSLVLTEEEIKKICENLGKQITEDYKDKKLLLVGALKGCFVFIADLMRQINLYCEIEFIEIASYVGNKSSGQILLKKDIERDLKGYDIIIVEDILDTGVTLYYLKQYLCERTDKSVKICTFLDKPSGRKADITADYIGATVPDGFMVGYGLDYDQHYRNLPYVGILDESIYIN